MRCWAAALDLKVPEITRQTVRWCVCARRGARRSVRSWVGAGRVVAWAGADLCEGAVVDEVAAEAAVEPLRTKTKLATAAAACDRGNRTVVSFRVREPRTRPRWTHRRDPRVRPR